MLALVKISPQKTKNLTKLFSLLFKINSEIILNFTSSYLLIQTVNKPQTNFVSIKLKKSYFIKYDIKSQLLIKISKFFTRNTDEVLIWKIYKNLMEFEYFKNKVLKVYKMRAGFDFSGEIFEDFYKNEKFNCFLINLSLFCLVFSSFSHKIEEVKVKVTKEDDIVFSSEGKSVCSTLISLSKRDGHFKDLKIFNNLEICFSLKEARIFSLILNEIILNKNEFVQVYFDTENLIVTSSSEGEIEVKYACVVREIVDLKEKVETGVNLNLREKVETGVNLLGVKDLNLFQLPSTRCYDDSQLEEGDENLYLDLNELNGNDRNGCFDEIPGTPTREELKTLF